MQRKDEKCIQTLVRKLKGRHHMEELGSINIKLDLEWIQLNLERVW
jgi:hypothetical protein